MAGEQGFEPRLPDPESGVLPLHHSPLSNEDSFYRLLRKSQGFAPRLSHRTEPAPSPALRAACHIARRAPCAYADVSPGRTACGIGFFVFPPLYAMLYSSLQWHVFLNRSLSSGAARSKADDNEKRGEPGGKKENRTELVPGCFVDAGLVRRRVALSGPRGERRKRVNSKEGVHR